MNKALVTQASSLAARPPGWVEVGLTLPIFLLYHVGIVFLDVRNAADFVTTELLDLAKGNLAYYLGLTAAIGVAFTGVFAIASRGQVFVPRKFLQMAVEGIVYAFAMAIVGTRVVGALFAATGRIGESGAFAGVIMSLGAGFYEELVFRVILFGLGAKLLVRVFAHQRVSLVGPRPPWTAKSALLVVGWALACAVVFSGVHYVGDLGDSFELRSFTYRFVLGVLLTLIFTTRGFAVAVWTHALYDIWVMVLR